MTTEVPAMGTTRWLQAAAAVLLAGALASGGARAQSFGSTGAQGTGSGQNTSTSTGTGSSSGSGQSTGAAINNAPTYDPAAQAAARLLGTYRVPGAAQI